MAFIKWEPLSMLAAPQDMWVCYCDDDGAVDVVPGDVIVLCEEWEDNTPTGSRQLMCISLCEHAAGRPYPWEEDSGYLGPVRATTWSIALSECELSFGNEIERLKKKQTTSEETTKGT